MKLSINPFLILRIPAFSFEEQIGTVWEDLKTFIAYSSPDFFDRIKEIGTEDLPGLDDKTKYTIWKYFNRAKYRGTPFGGFAGFATLELGHRDEVIFIEKTQHLHKFNDWGTVTEVHYTDALLFSPDRVYIANASIYFSPKSIRFLCLQNKSFELAQIERSRFIEQLLTICKDRVGIEQLQQFAIKEDVDEQVLKGILLSLIELQLLFTDLDRNIVGDDYYKRSGIPLRSTDQNYLIAERKVLSGSIINAKLQSLPGCIQYLLSIPSQAENPYLNAFKSDFLQRYEYQEQPLMKMLDPEFGIGYGDLENVPTGDILVNDLLETKKTEQARTCDPHNEFTKHLLNAILEHKGGKNQIIQLQEHQFKSTLNKVNKLPANSFSALLRLEDDLIVLDHVGGLTATALAGRFTLASETIEAHCKAIGKFENEANPDVIFFDIAYMAEGKVDNINRRKEIYDYELPLLNYSCSKHLIHLDDLLITIKNNEIILLSKRYEKRVIPRLASAYNYTRSDLPVYRFLCDLQHQNIRSQISFDIQSLIAGLNFYPRVQYGNVVLSAAKWKVNKQNFAAGNVTAQLELMQVTRYFTAGNGDQTLCFDRYCDADMLSFKRYLDQQTEFTITEMLMGEKPPVRDSDGRPYFTQFLITLQHSIPLYRPFSPAISSSEEKFPGVITPGRNWLYFEIYCHTQRSNEILNNAISKFIERYKAGFKCWFFIRYNQSENHLRLRLNLKDEKSSHLYTSKLMDELDEYFKAGFIKDIQLKTYRRELYRYGHAQIEDIEQHFSIDSAYSLNTIARNLGTDECYARCIGLMKNVIKEFDLDDKTKLAFVKNIQDSFIAAQGVENTGFKRINKAFEQFANGGACSLMNDTLPSAQVQLLQSFVSVIQTCPTELKLNMFIDLFHMHINRLFSDNQHAHEMVIYSFLYKQLLREHKSTQLVQTNP